VREGKGSGKTGVWARRIVKQKANPLKGGVWGGVWGGGGWRGGWLGWWFVVERETGKEVWGWVEIFGWWGSGCGGGKGFVGVGGVWGGVVGGGFVVWGGLLVWGLLGVCGGGCVFNAWGRVGVLVWLVGLLGGVGEPGV